MQPDITSIAHLIGDQARAKMLMALMSGKALTATELALEADITPQTASTHLAKLLGGELLVVRKQGRHRYFQLKGYEVAELLESLTTLSHRHTNVKTGPKAPELRAARICYDHLAGTAGVALYDSLVRQGLISERNNEACLTRDGEGFFKDLGCDLELLNRRKRPVCKSCLDWSERRNHLAGSLGQWILNDLLERTWASRELESRVLNFSKRGLNQFSRRYDLILDT